MEGAVRELNGVAGRVDGGRLWRRLMQMAEIGAIPGNGVNRQALSEEDIAARELLIDWARRRGYGVAVDDAANLFVRRPGSEPDLAPVLTGSHMDSQPRGGRFDGIYGVMAGLEALDALEDSGHRHAAPRRAGRLDERGGQPFRSRLHGLDGVLGRGPAGTVRGSGRRATEFRSAGRSRRTLGAAPDLPRRREPVPPAAYIEAHIEQGPVLEAAEDAPSAR